MTIEELLDHIGEALVSRPGVTDIGPSQYAETLAGFPVSFDDGSRFWIVAVQPGG